MPLAALLLDLDGTLVDSEPAHRAAYAAFFAGRGWDAPDLSIFTGRRAADVFGQNPGPWSGHDLDELSAEVVSLIDLEQAATPVHGAAALFDAAAHAGVRMAVVTSAGPDWVQHALGHSLGLLGHLDAVVTSEDVTTGKPDPAGYRRACVLLDVEPGTAAAVEDSPAGIRAALAAGVGTVFGLHTTHPATELHDAGASAVVADLEQVRVALFGDLPRRGQ